MPYLENDGIRLHYEVHGSGEPVVLLHGGTVDFQHNFGMYGWTERLMASGFQVVGLDFRGHGRSDKPHAVDSYGTARLASDVVALLQHLDLKRVALVAYSIGAAVALHLLHVLPQRFSRAALVAAGDGLVGYPPHTFSKVTPAIAFVLARAEYPRDLPRHLATYWNFVARTRGDPDALVALSKASYPPLTLEQAASVSTPVLVVSGEKDPVLGRGQRLAESLGQGDYLEIAGADHFSLAADTAVQGAVAAFVQVPDRHR